MLTLPQIYAKTDELRRRNAQYVRFLRTKKGYNSKGQGFIAVQSHSTRTVDKNGKQISGPSDTKYISMVTFIDKKLHVVCSCSCPDFMYRQEVALNKKGAAEIEYSNGELPTTTNSRMITYFCKHLCQIFFTIEKQIV